MLPLHHTPFLTMKYYHNECFFAINLVMSKKFQKKVEDFTCEKCGNFVAGGGYTNHCPKCLWSKHVDVNPGDREEKCGGMMKPVGAILIGGEYSINHQCEKCGFERKNKMSPKDSFDELIKISKR